MKKIILMFLILSASALGVLADNSVSVGSALIPQGKSGSFSIELTNSDSFASSMEVHLTLPDGITFESVSLTGRFTDNPTVGTTKSGQSVTITTLSTTNAPITGDSGPLLYITVSADESLTVGEPLTASVTKMEMARKVGTKHEKWNPEPFDFEIEITDRVILDENSTIIPSATDDEVDMLVKRTIKANQWSTICLPFDMTEEQVYAAFGDDVQLAEFDTDEGYTANGDGTITVNFIDTDVADGLYGNWPYIIKTSTDITEFEVTAQLAPAEDDAVAEYTTGRGKNKKTIGIFTGTLRAGTIIPKENLFLSDNKFYYSVGKTKCKAFRGYFWFEDVLESYSDAADARITISINNEATGIINVNDNENDDRYYDLQGRRVEKPGKGFYLKDGKKVVGR